MALLRQIARHEEKKHLKQFYASTLSPPFMREYLAKCDAVYERNGTGTYLRPPSTLTDHKIWLNLTICGILLAIAIALFAILRKKMFNQGVDRPLSAAYKTVNPTRNHWKTVIYGERTFESIAEEATNWHWYTGLRNGLSESDYELLTRGGPAALAYVRFQRVLLWYAVVICLIALIIILPVNLAGDLFLDILGRTSLVNLPPSSSSLWIHVLFSLALIPIGLLAMYDYGSESQRNPSRNTYSNTLMFGGLPADRANKQILREYFREAHPDADVANIELTYDVGYLVYLDKKLKETNDALEYCASLPDHSRRVIVEAGACSCCGCCLCCSDKTDGIDYYTTRRMQLAKELHGELERWKKVNPVFFVTFANEHQAKQVKRDYSSRCCDCHQRPKTRHSRELKTSSWTAYAAPHPASVYWENLSSDGCGWYARAIAVNLILIGLIVALAFFIVMLASKALPAVNNLIEKSPKGLCEILPALILWLILETGPWLVSRSVKVIGYWSRSNEIVAEIRYVFAALVLAVLLMPSFGLLILSNDHHLKPEATAPRLECTYLPDNGAVYIHFLIFFAFLSTAFSLFRPRVVLSFLWRIWKARSDAEAAMAGKVDTYFPYGEEYPQYLAVFAVTVAYSFLSPLITVFGVGALLLKYMLDQYMLCHIYKRSPAPTAAHSVAVIQFFGILLLQLLLISAVFILRNGLDACAVVLLAAFVLYSIFCVCMSVLGGWKHHSFLEFDDIDGNDATDHSLNEAALKNDFVQPILRHHQYYRTLLQRTARDT
ncbi:CSC1-like protein 1 [Paramacrobiotus metropolitanus]|uniref:CSC1-like protein 1 n=1 Tax=Paramacrobiotus metropolitanus TaxID=2943436 RepID=UPI00244638A5|nr:CSC1-like protein 1 [Paramacrobiotus metropolitanus]